MTVNADQLLKTIEHICAAPIEPDGWKTALHSLVDLLGAGAGTYSGSGENHGPYHPSFMIQTGIEKTAIKQYEEYYHTICERGRYSLREPVGSVYYDYKYFSESDIARSEYYDFLGRYDGKYGLGTTLARPGKGLDSFGTQQCALHYSGAQGHPDQEQLDIFQRLVPYLMRANAVSQKIGQQVSHSRSLETALDALPSAVICLGKGLSVEFANQKAGELLTTADGIEVISGKLCVTSQPAHAKILQVVRQLETGSSVHDLPPTYIALARPSGKRPYLLCLAPISFSEMSEDSVLFDRSLYLCTISDLQVSATDYQKQMETLFELTKTECELAEALSAGGSLKQFCNSRGGSVKTARWHLHSIFSKTNTSNQAELVSLINRIGR